MERFGPVYLYRQVKLFENQLLTREALINTLSNIQPAQIREMRAEDISVIPPELMQHLPKEVVYELGVDRLAALSMEQLESVQRVYGDSELCIEQTSKEQARNIKRSKQYTLGEMITRAIGRVRAKEKKERLNHLTRHQQSELFSHHGEWYVRLFHLADKTSLSELFWKDCAAREGIRCVQVSTEGLGLHKLDVIRYLESIRKPQGIFESLATPGGRSVTLVRVGDQPLTPLTDIPQLYSASTFAEQWPRKWGSGTGISKQRFSNELQAGKIACYNTGKKYLIHPEDFHQSIVRLFKPVMELEDVLQGLLYEGNIHEFVPLWWVCEKTKSTSTDWEGVPTIDMGEEEGGLFILYERIAHKLC